MYRQLRYASNFTTTRHDNRNELKSLAKLTHQSTNPQPRLPCVAVSSIRQSWQPHEFHFYFAHSNTANESLLQRRSHGPSLSQLSLERNVKHKFYANQHSLNVSSTITTTEFASAPENNTSFLLHFSRRLATSTRTHSLAQRILYGELQVWCLWPLRPPAQRSGTRFALTQVT